MVLGNAWDEAPPVQRQRGEVYQRWAIPVKRDGLLFLDPGMQTQAPGFLIEVA